MSSIVSDRLESLDPSLTFLTRGEQYQAQANLPPISSKLEPSSTSIIPKIKIKFKASASGSTDVAAPGSPQVLKIDQQREASPDPISMTSRSNNRGRGRPRKLPDEDSDPEFSQQSGDEDISESSESSRGHGKSKRRKNYEESDYSGSDTRKRRRNSINDFVEDDSDDYSEDEDGSMKLKSRNQSRSVKSFPATARRNNSRAVKNPPLQHERTGGTSRRSLRSQGSINDDEEYHEYDEADYNDAAPRHSEATIEKHDAQNDEEDADGEIDAGDFAEDVKIVDQHGDDEDSEDSDPVIIRPRPTRRPNEAPRRMTRNSNRRDFDEESDDMPTRRILRERKDRPDYAIPQPLELDELQGGRRNGKTSSNQYNNIPWNLKGKNLSRHLGIPDRNDSDDDLPTNTPRKTAANPFVGNLGMFPGAAPGLPLDIGTAAGGPSNHGKIGDAALSDADPLGVNTLVTFDEVGGLDDHIKQLKEMVSLPLLYPELFQKFHVTPPRGVLFHGPPGTGKTLVARALAASCSTGETKISFFMRKGADCLSKWVGEAERQLRLLFEEARACQPSIIFFDEIDGLAPVRSSKQDQIHASIVSTLLALMDGMDGRGQVVVIGATNRPDSVDPALRRPGRFDREFYFPLPNKTARRKILDIHTNGWQPTLDDKFMDQLATLTKGYGGADLRALCTEASLNAIQRRYPQIYKTNDRLLLAPETISVQGRDFMVSIKNMIPSSARSTASAAAPLPAQLTPLLSECLEAAKKATDKALPPIKKRSVLEEAEWETDDPMEGTIEREMMLQSLETLRVYRPRVIIHGKPGMGQSYLGSALMHHLEGFHVQSLDLATLMGDSTRSVEAAVIQLFVEAKRHKPSIVYIPSLTQWCTTVSETTRSTLKALLDSLSSSDPVLLLAVVDEPIENVPRDVKTWFGYSKENRIEIKGPSENQRQEFFCDLLTNIQRPPNEFPDAMPKRRRILEDLPIAPPLPPREPTAAEIAQSQQADARLREHLKWRLGPVLEELKKKYRRFMKPFTDYIMFFDQSVNEIEREDIDAAAAVTDGVEETSNGPLAVHQSRYRPKRPHNVDLDKIHSNLFKNRYLTPRQFLDDIVKIVENAENAPRDKDYNADLLRARQMLNHSNILIETCCDAAFSAECQRMSDREIQREIDFAAKQPPPLQELQDPVTTDLQPLENDSNNINELDAPAEKDVLEAAESRKRSLEEVLTDGSPSRMDVDHPETKRLKVNGDAVGFSQAVDDDAVMDLVSTPVKASRSTGFTQDLVSQGWTPAGATTPSAVGTPSVVAATPTYTKLNLQGNEEATSAHNGVQLVPDVPTTNGIHPPTNGTAEPALSNAAVSASSIAVPAKPLERVPTPPEPVFFPEFEIDSSVVEEIRRALVQETSALNVEQLEQLRAMCLELVWRHRSSWNRSELLSEMVDLIREYREEIEEDLRAIDLEDAEAAF